MGFMGDTSIFFKSSKAGDHRSPLRLNWGPCLNRLFWNLRADCLFPEYISVCTGTFQIESLIVQSIYQQPVWFDMTIPATFEIAFQWMIPIFQRQSFSSYKHSDYNLDFISVFPASNH